ncbi:MULTISPECIES: cell division protein FtsQ/DivIB [Methylococcus]|uniref:Cell division protein FtsQ n=1 Tax=Methylococcus capsulatus TaxID=414 RepID=A0ABZ2FAG8_METCP|nr:cell division protein FtsQ/DivIB [Methylococcus capsulatus]MDF9391300.1 FtsQ-type POTRA domain-containing protein [Methylococcus capsulatus]
MAHPGNQCRLKPKRRQPDGNAAIPGGRSLRVSIMALFALGLIWGGVGWGVSWLAEQRVHTVRVKGAFRHIDPTVVEDIVRGKLGGGKTYFRIPLAEIRQAVTSIPWVAEATVERRWPDRIEVEVQEHRPVARWGDGDFIDDRMNRFHIGSTLGFEHLPLLTGPDGQERRLIKVLIDLDERFESWGTRVAELRLTDRWSWSLRLESDLRIEFGRREPVEAIASLLSLLPLLGKDRMALLQSIDLRYPYGFAVVWKTYQPDVEAPPEPPGAVPPA